MRLELGVKGRALLKSDEALRLTTYDDATGKAIGAGDACIGKPTIGWGHTGVEAVPGAVITTEGAERLFDYDVEMRLGIANALIHPSVTINQNQFDALFCMGFNVGFGVRGLAGSTLIHKLNDGDFIGASAEFPHWNKSGGKVNEGLIKRRADERRLFDTPV